MTGSEICKRAVELKNDKYWYGGKHTLATINLANQLRHENPSVWTYSYYEKAIKDIDGHTMVCDCSGLVCYAYQIGELSSYGLHDRYLMWKDAPRDGMILWRKGHVGIYEGGHVHELRGIDYDYQFNAYDPDRWTAVLYDPTVDYETSAYPIGWNCDMNTGRWWYQYGPGKEEYYKDRIVRINGSYYAFGKDGYMVQGRGFFDTDENGEIVGVN